jgi:hypothetical protein
MIRFSNFLTALFTLLSIAGFTSIQAQSIFNLFEENNTLKIQEWIKANPSGQIDILNDRLHDFYEKRLPAQKLNCVGDKMNILELAILNGNSIIYNELLSIPNYYQNKELLSQALNFAVAKNNAELFKKLESMGATYNAKSAYFFNQNSLQIAFNFVPGSDLTKMIMEKSTSADFNHVDCLGNTALHYLSSSKNVDLSKFPVDKMRSALFSGDDDMEYPIELLVKNGNLAGARVIWSAMREHENFENYETIANFKRLKYHALLSRNDQAHAWVDSLVVKTFKVEKKKVHAFYMEDGSFDLNIFIDGALMASNYFFDLKLIDKNAKETNFLAFLNSWQKLINKELGIQQNIKPTIHSASGLVSISDLRYLGRFYTHQYWNSLLSKKISADDLEKIQTQQDPFWNFLDLPFPKKFQTNFHVEFDNLSGYRDETNERFKFILSELNIFQLTVKNVRDQPIEFTTLFPNLQHLEIQWIDKDMPLFNVGRDLLSCKTIKFVGMSEIQFPQNIGKINLETIIVPTDAELVDLPKGLKVLYE